MSKSLARVLRALARQGLDVKKHGLVYQVRQKNTPNAPAAEVLLPEDFKLEAKALLQLTNLAAVQHPSGRGVRHCCATPDFHPGDSGIPIGSVVVTETENSIVIPAAVGSDINCGMRLHHTDLDVDGFLARKDALVALLKGDYLLGTRDIGMYGDAVHGLFEAGISGWHAHARHRPVGLAKHVNFDQVEDDFTHHTHLNGGLACTDTSDVPPKLFGGRDVVVRPEDLGTIGRGNHFVEIQVIDEILDRGRAWQWFGAGVRPGLVVCMIHSGSRSVGKAIGSNWLDRARRAWPPDQKFPRSKIFPILTDSVRFDEYQQSQAAAANYGFVNRMLLGELWRRRMREVFGERELPLLWDQPHNLMTREPDGNGRDVWVTRKGACPAHLDKPTLIPGSMGTSSYLCVGLGNAQFYSTASHGAGRATSRGRMGRTIKDAAHERALGLQGVTCITLREERRVEEAPAAYKPIDPVIDVQVQAGTIAPVVRFRPLLTFKA